jgi:hypothetical protein
MGEDKNLSGEHILEAAPINMEFNGCSIAMKNKDCFEYGEHYKNNYHSQGIS